MATNAGFARIMPYADWLNMAFRFGLGAYYLYQFGTGIYQKYCAQMELDARDGCVRSFNDTIELVVKPRRRRIHNGNETNNNENSNNSGERATQGNNQNDALATEPSTSNMYPILAPGPDDEPVPSTSGLQKNATRNQEDANVSKDSDISCVYDSREFPKVESNDDDTISSTASTSLESTDTSRGIVRDMENECFICACSLSDTRKPEATLPFCMHTFHKSCLDGVLRWHSKCPICDTHMFTTV